MVLELGEAMVVQNQAGSRKAFGQQVAVVPNIRKRKYSPATTTPLLLCHALGPPPGFSNGVD